MSTTQATASSVSEFSASDFLERLNALREEYVNNNDDVRTQWRNSLVEDATHHFANEFLTSDDAWQRFLRDLEDNVRLSGKQTVTLFRWSGHPGKQSPSYRGQTLLDLLNFGDLLSVMQDTLDVRMGEGNFIVFHHTVSTGQRGPFTFYITVSWDQSGFDNAREIIKSNRQHAERRRMQAQERRANANQNDRNDDRGPYRRNTGPRNPRPRPNATGPRGQRHVDRVERVDRVDRVDRNRSDESSRPQRRGF